MEMKTWLITEGVDMVDADMVDVDMVDADTTAGDFTDRHDFCGDVNDWTRPYCRSFDCL